MDMDRLKDIVARLRGPEGCPWDKKQTHQSLVPYLLEEAWEVIEEIEQGRHGEALEDELGDLLFQVILHSQIAEEQGRFTLQQVIDRISKKMVERHPHVFDAANREQSDDELRQQWDRIKTRAKTRESVLDGIPTHQPQLMQAKKIGERAAGIGFEFPTSDDILGKIEEELAEVRESLVQGDKQALQGEIGDLLFAVVNLARFHKIDPEIALKQTNDKFKFRFAWVEAGHKAAQAQGKQLTLAEMDELWNQAKR